ncbi:conjugative transposon protein [Fusobacterium necrophorum subsp. funduliforme B35]|uniref:Conjugative transposon protein n=1 Tax=Fusobacterium necrophorum subsp. funduliforme B35 TaxID=1226633 RepID=A0A017H6W9_9FUSO|nr:PDDEXK nuclease domain-containing protein [Fusobacterium necrophorum]EYD70292.1 conjugative transposon protein [Fusobacterium necrophorum subsp. funduliforme B35]KID49830.1 conjugative transposon protein [Fusobacterium necrophorum subsp. funduliforme B35]
MDKEKNSLQNIDVEKNNNPFEEIVRIVENAKDRAYRKVNEELVLMYQEIGKYISEKTKEASYGSGFVDNVAKFFSTNYPELKGFNRRGLYRMKQFYELYKDDEKVSTLLTQLSWSNHLKIMSGAKSREEREFYINLAIKEKLTHRELLRQMDSGYYERYMLSKEDNLPAIQRAKQETHNLFMDSYVLEFLDAPKIRNETEFQKSILENLKNFILEIGKDFSFIGNEYRVQVGNHDYYIDLLFYHRGLSCLVAFELKIGEFKPEYIGKMNLYLEVLDREVKKKTENPSVGVILCASKDDEVVEFALSRSLSPTMVSEYKLKLIDKSLLQRKLKEYTEIAEEANR